MKPCLHANGNQIISFERFKEMFRNRFWSKEIQREILYNLKWGKCKFDNKQDYLEKLLAKVRFVEKKLSNNQYSELDYNFE